MGKNNEITVYWTLYNHFSDHKFDKQLLDLEPVPVFSNLVKRRSSNFRIPQVQPLESNGYQTCTALKQISNNMFMINSPFDMEINFNEDWSIIRETILSIFFSERVSSLDNSIAFDFNICHLFFSEEELEVEILPAFMHNTEQSKYGFPAMASFDISKWFRPVILSYHLWPGIKKYKVKTNEPIAYIRFKTDKKINFQYFVQSKEIRELAIACMNYKKINEFVPLLSLYDRFKRTNMNKLVLREIKGQLLE